MTTTAKELYSKLDPYVVERIRSILSATSVTASTSGTGGADSATVDAIRAAAFVTIGSNGTLNAERSLAVSGALDINDGGPNSDVTLTLATPGTLTVDSTNDATTNHTHVITSSSSPGATSALLKSNSTGGLTLVSATATTNVITPQVATASGTLTLAPANSAVDVVGSANVYGNLTASTDSYTSFNMYAAGSAAFPLMALGRSRGTGASRSALQSGDQISALRFQGYHSGNAFHLNASIDAYATQNYTGTAGGAALVFSTTPNDSATIAERMRIHNSGNVSIGNTTDSGYDLDVTSTIRAVTSLTTPLITTSSGDLTLDPAGSNVAISANAVITGSVDATGNINADQGLTAANSTFRVIYHTHDGTDHAHVVIDPAEDWILDEAFDVDVGQNLLVRGYIVGKHALQLPGAVMICHYDGRTPYTIDYDGTTIGHKGQVATVAGGIIFRPGKFSKAIQVADQTENLITNPSFETGVIGWTASGGATFTQNDTFFYIGSYGAKFVAADASGTATSNTFDAYAEDFTSVSLWYQKETSIGGTGKVRIDYYNSSNVFISSAELTLPAGDVTEWTYATLSSENPTGARYGKLVITSQGCVTGCTIYVDAVQAENYYASTPYADGTLGVGHAWAGTAHASRSTRDGGRVTYSTDTLKTITRKFTVGCWVRRAGLSPGYIWSFGNGTSLRVGV